MVPFNGNYTPDFYLIKVSAEDQGSQWGLPTICPLVATSAFVGTNPTGELITSGFLVTRAEPRNRRVALLITLIYR